MPETSLKPPRRGRPPGKAYAGRLDVHLTAEQLAFIEEMAERYDRPLSATIRKLVAEAMRRQKKRAAGVEHA